MPHQRQLIRRAVQAMLVDKTAAVKAVQTTRIIPYRKSELPAIGIYTPREAVDREASGTSPRDIERELELEIAGWVGPGECQDDALDELALEIETAMNANEQLDGTAIDSMLVSTETSFREEGEAVFGVVVLTYAVTYRTLAVEAPANLHDFEKVDARHRHTGLTDVTDPAHVLDGHDTFVVEESP